MQSIVDIRTTAPGVCDLADEELIDQDAVDVLLRDWFPTADCSVLACPSFRGMPGFVKLVDDGNW